MFCKKYLLFHLLCLSLLLSGSAFAAESNDEKSNTWLKAQLMTSYTLNEYINPFKIDVEVKDGIAYLSGTVDSKIERDLAVEIARGIDGIKDVREDLVLRPDEKAREKSGFARKVEDATLTAKVKYRLLLNKHLDSLDINVNTSNAVVTLSGNVDAGEKKALAIRLAENTAGVAKVVDNLSVATEKQEKTADSLGKKVDSLSASLKDTWITTKARSLLLISTEAEGARYQISTSNGIITVSGEVLSGRQADDIQKILEDLQGVREVKNKFEVVDR